MIFKSWLTDLQSVQGVVNNLKNTKALVDGANNLLEPSSVRNLSAAISGLNLQQAQLALSTKHLTAEQKNQVLVQAGLIASEDKIQAELAQSTLAQAGLSKEKQNAILIDLGLMNAETQELFTTRACTKEELLNMLATKGVTGANADAIVSTLGLAGANAGTTVSFDLLTKSIWANVTAILSWLATNPVGWLVLLGTAIVGTVALNHKYNESLKEIQENAEEAKNKISSLKDELAELTTNTDDLIESYAELAQGIDQINGKNISLSDDEYAKFLDTSNQLAELFPTLTKRYDENGNAILDLQGDVVSITSALEGMLEVEKKLYNKQILEQMPDIFAGASANINSYQNKIQELEYQIKQYDNEVTNIEGRLNSQWAGKYAASNMGIEIIGGAGKQFKENLEKEFEEYQIDATISWSYEETAGYDNFKIDGIETETEYNAYLKALENAYAKTYSNIQQNIQDTNSQIKRELAEFSPYLNTWLSENFTYSQDFSSEMKGAFEEFLYNTNYMKDSGANDWDELTDWIESTYLEPIAEAIEENPAVEEAFVNLFSTDFSNMSVDEAQKLINSYINTLAELLDKDPIELKVSLGFDKYDDVASNYHTMLINAAKQASGATDGEIINGRGRYQEIYDKIDKFATEYSINTQDEIAAFQDALNKANGDIDKAFKYYLEKNYNSGADTFPDIFALEDVEGELTDLGKINQELDDLQTAYTGLKSAMDSYNETGYLSLDQVQEIISYGDGYLKYLMDENGNLQLNEEALNNVAIARINEMRAKALSNLMDNLESITNEESALNYLETQLLATAQGYDDFTASRMAAWSAKALEEYGMDSTVVDGVLTSFKNQASAINEMFDNINIGSINGSLDDAASAAETDWKALLDNELTILEKQLELGLISFDEYLDKRRDLIEDYYADGKLSAAEYYEYLEKHYENQLSYMDKVINAVTRKIDKEIDKLKDKQEEIEEHYNLQIEYLEEQKTALEEANAERQRQIDLQKALYELERAQNQRTTLMYSEEKGMHYVADGKAIRDAQQDVEDAEFEIKISEIEKAIVKLEEARDRELEAIDEMIEKLEEYKEYWEEIAHEFEYQQEEMIAAQILGQDWEKKILDGRLDTLKKFKDEYIAIQQAILDAQYQAALALGQEAEHVKLKDSYKPQSDPNGNGKYVVIDESGEEEDCYFNTKAEAEAYRDSRNKKKAQAYGIDTTKNDWKKKWANTNIPGYYIKGVLEKFHTGLAKGPVSSHSYDEDLKLVQDVGLGNKEVLTILEEQEVVATPEQVSNLANGLRMPSYLQPMSPDSHLMKMIKSFEGLLTGHSPIMENNLVKQMGESMSKLANTISNTTNTQNIHQTFNITMPVTNEATAVSLLRDLESLATKKLHAFNLK